MEKVILTCFFLLVCVSASVSQDFHRNQKSPGILRVGLQVLATDAKPMVNAKCTVRVM
ncbi:hypothetical protein Lser_V15G13271 [Lactuca serriola]